MFNPAEYLTKLKGKDYLEVKWRLAWFRDQHPHGVIATTLVHLDIEKGLALFKSSIDDGEGGHAEGHGSETSKDFGDYIEKAETKAIGRALAALGYGTQFAPDLEEGERVVDSPVTRSNVNARPSAPSSQPTTTAPKPISDEHPGGITDEQKNAIRKLSSVAGFDVPATLDTMTYYQAKGEIQRLNKLTKSSQRAS